MQQMFQKSCARKNVFFLCLLHQKPDHESKCNQFSKVQEQHALHTRRFAQRTPLNTEVQLSPLNSNWYLAGMSFKLQFFSFSNRADLFVEAAKETKVQHFLDNWVKITVNFFL